jgi:hypothetical protein
VTACAVIRSRTRVIQCTDKCTSCLACSDATEDSESEDTDDGSCISGDFINDGTYTQHTSPSGAETQYGMYLAVNNYHTHMRSPDDVMGGRFNIADLVRGPRKVHFSSPSDASVSILDDTPVTMRHPSKRNGSARASRSDVGADDLEDTASDDSKSQSSSSELEEGEAEFSTQPSKTKAKRTGAKRKASVSSKLAPAGTDSSGGIAAPFWERLKTKRDAAQAGLSSSEDSDTDINPHRKRVVARGIQDTAAPIGVGVKPVSVAKAGDCGREVAAGVGKIGEPTRRPPLAPLSANASREANTVKAAGQPKDDIFTWDF